MEEKSSQPLEIFYCYAHKDRTLLEELDAHLAGLYRSYPIVTWYDGEIVPGASWKEEIETHLNAADIILLLISSDFIKSDYCYIKEMERALERQRAKEVEVVPILLRPTDCAGTPFSELQMLPTGVLAITSWSNLDKAFEDVARGIRRVVEKLLSQSAITSNSTLAKSLDQAQQIIVASSSQPTATLLPASSPSTSSSSQQPLRIPRRTLLVGAAVLSITGVGLIWFTRSRYSTRSNSTHNTSTVTLTPTSPPIPVGTIVTTYLGHAATVRKVAWSPDSRRIASAGEDATVQIWWVAFGSHIFTYLGHTPPNYPVDLAWSPDGKSIASASQVDVHIWDATLNATTGKRSLTYHSPSGSISCIAWSPDGKRIAVGDVNSTIQVFDAATGNILHTYRSSFQYVYGLAWSPDSIYLASRASAQAVDPVNANVQVWNTFTGKSVFTSVDPRSDGGKVAWSPKGGLIAAGNGDPSPQTIVRILDATTGNTSLIYSGHTLGVNGLDWSPDGTYVASGSYDATVQIWNARTGDTSYSMNHSDSVFAVAWSPNGAFIASGGGGNNTVPNYTVKVWKAV